MTDDLLQILREFETELHQEAARQDASRMEMLLHPEFQEFGRSGRRFSRDDTLTEFSSAGARLPPVVSDGFAVHELGEQLALLTYVSAHLDRSGHPYRYTLRSSIWMLTPTGWRMRFHQGTPTDALSQSSSREGE